MKVEKALEDDVAEILHLLKQNGLPSEGLSDRLATTVVAREDGRVIGSAALEVYATGALLRSVAVDQALRGRGVGHELIEAAIEMATARGLPAVYLLTTTAEGFFPKFGFSRITREEVPSNVQASVEFKSVCPSTAIVMRRYLSP